MMRRSTPQQHLAERHFPVRVRVAVPPKGFGEQINTMHGWLDQHIGKGRHWVGADVEPGRADAALFYFVDARDAVAFIDRFACGVLVGQYPPR
jgi:hypothetical protein